MDRRTIAAPGRIFGLLSPHENIGVFAMFHCLIGRRETGKTTLAVYGARAGNPPRLIFDPSNRIFPRGDGLKVYSADELIDHYPALLQGDTHEVIYSPVGDGIANGFLQWSELIRVHVTEAKRRRRLSAVIDEAVLVDSDIGDPDHPISQAMTFCRRDRVHFFLTCHQPKDIPTRKRAISDFLIFFHTTQEHDLRVISDRCSEAFAARVARLAPFHFLIWNDKDGAERACYLRPNDWRLDLDERDEPEPAPRPSPIVSIDRGNLWR
jgi:hypothetical protein